MDEGWIAVDHEEEKGGRGVDNCKVMLILNHCKLFFDVLRVTIGSTVSGG